MLFPCSLLARPSGKDSIRSIQIIPSQSISFSQAGPLFQFFGFFYSLLFTYLKPRARIFKLLRSPSILRNQFHQAVYPVGPVRQPILLGSQPPQIVYKFQHWIVEQIVTVINRIEYNTVCYLEKLCVDLFRFFSVRTSTLSWGSRSFITTITISSKQVTTLNKNNT